MPFSRTCMRVSGYSKNTNPMNSLYSDTIIEYAKTPPNRGVMFEPTVSYNEENRNCGDTIEVFLRIEEGRISDFSFTGHTSIITTACASLFGESILGMETSEILSLDSAYIVSLLGMEVTPRRRQGSVFGLLATRNAIHRYLGDGRVDDFTDVL